MGAAPSHPQQFDEKGGPQDVVDRRNAVQQLRAAVQHDIESQYVLVDGEIPNSSH